MDRIRRSGGEETEEGDGEGGGGRRRGVNDERRMWSRREHGGERLSGNKCQRKGETADSIEEACFK